MKTFEIYQSLALALGKFFYQPTKHKTYMADYKVTGQNRAADKLFSIMIQSHSQDHILIPRLAKILQLKKNSNHNIFYRTRMSQSPSVDIFRSGLLVNLIAVLQSIGNDEKLLGIKSHDISSQECQFFSLGTFIIENISP